MRIVYSPLENPSHADVIKQDAAGMIDYCDSMKHEKAVSEKASKLSPEDYREALKEKHRLIELAKTAYETAAMWAVKASETNLLG